jgi:hypothetical protein
MKKIIILLLGIGLIVGLTFLTINLSKDSKATDTSLIAFAVKDTANVNRIEIYDTYQDMSFTLVRNEDGAWEDNEGNCVQQDIAQMMLTTMVKITLKGYVPKAAMENMKSMMMAKHKRVKIFKNGDWVKTWYVGHSTQDHMGTHMLLETPEIKSSNPVIMGMKGFYGILEPRFFADPRRFACTQLFSFKRNDLSSIELKNYVITEESFKVSVNGTEYQVSSNGKPLQNVNEDNLLFYLNGFENIHFNQPNYTLSTSQIDSIKSKNPDYKLNIIGKSKSYSLDMYRRPDPEYAGMDTVAWDPDYLWAVKEDGELVRMQYYTVGPLIQGQTVFVNN